MQGQHLSIYAYTDAPGETLRRLGPSAAARSAVHTHKAVPSSLWGGEHEHAQKERGAQQPHDAQRRRELGGAGGAGVRCAAAGSRRVRRAAVGVAAYLRLDVDA